LEIRLEDQLKEERILSPGAVAYLTRKVEEVIARSSADSGTQRAEGKLRRLERECEHIKQAVRLGKATATLLEMLEETEERAALADAWLINPHATLPVLTRQLMLYREEVGHSGKRVESIEVPLMREVYVAPSVREAQADAFPALAAKYDRYVVWGQQRAMGASGRLSLPVEDLARDRFIIGDPAYCIEEIHRYRQHLSVTHLILRSQWPGLPHELTIRSLRLFGERVIPAFTD